MNNLVNYMFKDTSPEDTGMDFATFGKDIFDSEELTDHVYSAFLNMIVEGWHGEVGGNSNEFHISDVGVIYKIGPYVPCVERVSFTRHIDLKSDGLPGIRVVGSLQGEPGTVACVRPVDRLPNDIQILGRSIKKYKYVSLFQSEKDKKVMDSLTLWFGINKQGKILSAYNKRAARPEVWHGAAQIFPSVAINAWADSKYLWLANTSEDIGMCDLKLRLGLSKEHIKSLFYARSLPITETGRKRPILHWVRAHKRRIKEGIDIDINNYLRGITELEMDGLRFRITQPNKEELHKSEPETIRQAFKMYA